MTELVAQVQAALAQKHFNPGPADGLWGPRTRQAMQGYEIANHMPVTDTLTDTVLANLLGRSTPAPIGWLDEAAHLLGLREGPGAKDNEQILDWAQDLELYYPHDDWPWCGLFNAHCVRAALPNEPLPANPLGARQWEKFGVPCAPQLGAVAVFWRQSPKSGLGHTGFMIGERSEAYLIRGGNQSDSVKDVWVSKARFLGARWPSTGPKPLGRPLTVGGAGVLSKNEA
jgi:uncharacterized protein (TIGR02594 family)